MKTLTHALTTDTVANIYNNTHKMIKAKESRTKQTSLLDSSLESLSTLVIRAYGLRFKVSLFIHVDMHKL